MAPEKDRTENIYDEVDVEYNIVKKQIIPDRFVSMYDESNKRKGLSKKDQLKRVTKRKAQKTARKQTRGKK